MYPTNSPIERISESYSRCCVDIVWLKNALYSSQNVEGLNILEGLNFEYM